MPRRVNKPAVAIMTLVVMAMTIVVGVLLVRAIPSKDPLPLAKKAEEAIARNDYRLAMTFYQQAYGRSRDPKYIVLAGNAARDGGERGAAQGLWQQAILKDPNCLEARQNSVAFWIELLEMYDWRISPGDASQIRSDAEALLKSQPDDFAGLFARGFACTNIPDQPHLAPEGIEDLQKAIGLKPSDLRVQAVLSSYWIGKGQPEQAEQFFQDRIARLPEDPCGYLMLGQIRLRQRKIDEAIEQLKKAASLAKAMPEAPTALAQAYVQKRDYAAADELLAQTIRDHPDFFPGFSQRVEMLMLADRAPEALAQAEEWLERPQILHGYKAYRNRNERLLMQVLAASAALAAATPDKGEAVPTDAALVTKAEGYVKAVEKEAGQSSGYTQRLWGRIFRLKGNIVEATKWLEQADKSFGGTDPDVRLRLAELYQTQRELGLTKQMLDSVIKMAPQFARAHYMAAVVAAQTNDVADALNKVEACLALEPDNREALQLKATLLRATDRKAQASAIDEKIGAPTTVAEQLQRAYQRLSDRNPKEAEAIYRNILSSDPANPQALRMLMDLLLQENRDQEARTVYDAARAAAPDSREIRQLELIFARTLPKEQQDQEMLKLIQAEPDEETRNTQLTTYYATRQKFDEAKKIADEMEKKQPESERVVSLQFGLALATQDWTRAQKYAEIAGRKGMDGADGGFYRARLATARNDLQKAQDELNGALLKYPSFSEGWVQLGNVCLRLNRIDEARKSLAKALELNPTKGEAYKGLAQIAAVRDDQTAFEENLTKAVQYLQEDAWVAEQWMRLRERKDPQGTIAIRQRMLEANPDDVDNMVRLALLHEGQEQYKQAAELIGRAQKKLPKDPQLAWLVANYWQRRDDGVRAEKALLDLAEAVDADQKADATLLLGRLYVLQEQPEKAEQTLNIAAKQAPDQPGPYLELASYYRSAGRIDDAVKAYRQAVAAPKKEPGTDSMIRQQMIETLLQSRKLEDAGKEIEAFQAAFPDEDVHQLLRGTLQMLQGHPEESIGTLTAYLQRQPNSAPGRYHRGKLYLATNRLPQAIDDLAMAKQLSPNGFNLEHRAALAQAHEASGKPQEAIAELNEILRDYPQAVPVARMLAGLYQRAGRMDDLEIHIRKYMDLAPQDATWPQALGQLGEATGKYDIAVSGYTAAAKASQYAVEPVDNVLRLYISAKRYDQVIEFVEKTMPEDARMGVAKARLAQAYFLQGNQEKGRTLFSQAVAEASKEYVSSLLVLRVAETALGSAETTDLLKQRMEAEPDNLIVKYMLIAVLASQQQWDAAEKLSTELLAMARSDEEKAQVLRQRGGMLYQAKKREAAAAAFEELLKVAPDDAEALNNVAYTLAEDLNRPQEALRYAKRAVELRPRDANVMDTLGWVYCLAGDLDNAVGTLVSALQVSPDNIAVRYHVAMVYKKQGKMDQAKEEFLQSQQLIEKAPKDPIAQMFQDRVKEELSSLSGAAGK
jgi:tetratricopeptide (TPR) repeat protein